MRYRLVEWETKEHGTVKAPNVTILEGPIENALIVTVADEMLQRLIPLGPDRLQAFVDRTRETMREAGWEGEIVICSDDMKFARFERLEPLTEAAHEVKADLSSMPSLPEVEAEQSRAVQRLAVEDDKKILDGVRRALGAKEEKVCPHCGDSGCAGAVYDPGDCPQAP